MANAEPLIQEIITRVSGEQELKSLISGLQAHADAMRQANGAANDAVNAHKKVGDEVRKQRQAFSQSGMQINQFMGQITAGTPVMTALVQQLGDITYVIGQAGGAMGRFGAFLSGPWGAAILVGISVLGPLIAKLWESKDAAEEAQSAFSKYINSISTASKVADVFTENGRAIAETRGKVSQLTAELTKLTNTPVEFKGEAAYAAAKTARDTRIRAINAELAAGKSLIKQKEDEIAAVKQQAKLDEQRKNAADSVRQSNSKSGSSSAGKAASSVRAVKDEIDPLSKEINDSLAGSMKALDNFSENYGQQTADTTRAYYDQWAKTLEQKKQLEDFYAQQQIDTFTAQREAIDNFANTMDQGLKGLITGAMSFKDMMKSVINSVISDLWRLYVTQQITGFIKKSLGGLFNTPGKAIGGPVQAGSPYMVGERGPELFVPSRSGSIVPNNKLGGSGYVINVDARGASDPAAVRQQVEMGIMQAAPFIIAAAQNRTIKTAGRARLPGTIG